jgi:hypothetical protein
METSTAPIQLIKKEKTKLAALVSQQLLFALKIKAEQNKQ